MEQQKLPNATMIIVLGIFGYLCCCFAGLGIIPSGIAYFMANKSDKIYANSPELYTNISTVKTGKTVALIALIINALMLGFFVYSISSVGWQEWSEEFSRQWNEGMNSGGQY